MKRKERTETELYMNEENYDSRNGEKKNRKEREQISKILYVHRSKEFDQTLDSLH